MHLAGQKPSPPRPIDLPNGGDVSRLASLNHLNDALLSVVRQRELPRLLNAEHLPVSRNRSSGRKRRGRNPITPPVRD